MINCVGLKGLMLYKNIFVFLLGGVQKMEPVASETITVTNTGTATGDKKRLKDVILSEGKSHCTYEQTVFNAYSLFTPCQELRPSTTSLHLLQFWPQSPTSPNVVLRFSSPPPHPTSKCFFAYHAAI